MSVTNADVIAGQWERYRPKLQQLYETTYGVGAKIKKAAESHRISTWSQALASGQTLQAFRVPIRKYAGGDFGTFDYNEGDLGGGSMTREDFMSLGYFPTEYAVEIPQLSIKATATSEQAVANVLKLQLKDAITEMQHYYDTGLHQDGTGVLAIGNGTGTPLDSNPTYNLEANFGPQRLRYNQPVDVYNAATTSKKNAATVRVASYSFPNKTVTLSGTVTSAANDDVIAFRGMSATLAVGSWQNGIYTFNNTATSGFTAGLDRAVVTELQTPYIDAGGAGLVPAFGLALNDQIIQRRDEKALANMIGLSHMAQRAAWYLQGIGISEWHRGASDKMIDLVPGKVNYNTTFTMCNVEHMVSKKQDRSRVDWIIPGNYARALLHDMDFFEGPDGQRFFVVRSSTTGNPKAGFLFYMIAAENLISCDPGAGGIIENLAVPSGY